MTHTVVLSLSVQIDVVADLPVGNNLEDHYMTHLAFTVKEPLTVTDKHLDDPWTVFNYTFGGTGVYITASVLRYCF